MTYEEYYIILYFQTLVVKIKDFYNVFTTKYL
jgi:hypothetical protein